MNRILSSLVVAVLASVAFSTALAQSGAKIAVFDPQRVSEETSEGQRIQGELNAFQNRKQQELTDLQNEVQTLRQQLTTQAISLSADKRADLEKTIQRKILELQSAEEGANRELQLEVAAAQNRFQEQLLGVVQSFGRDEGFTIILDYGSVAWASESIDVTTAIVDRFNAMFATPDPPPASAEPDGAGDQ